MGDGDEAALIELIYKAPLSPNGWQAVFDETRRMLGLHGVGGIETRVEGAAPPAASLRALSGVPVALFASYRDYYVTRDPNLAYARQQPVGTVWGEPLGFSTEAFRRGEIFNDVVRPNGGDCPIVAVLGKDGSNVSELWAYPSFGRQFTPEQVGALQRLVPHICHSIRFEAELNRRAAIGSLALSHVAKPMFIVDRIAFVHACNEPAVALLDARPARLALTADGRLAMRGGDGSPHLDRAIAQALRAADGAAPPAIFRISADISVMVTPGGPQPAHVHAGNPLVSVLMNVANALPASDAALLQQKFHFTPAEAAIVADLAQGQSVEDIAKQRYLKRDTVYVHIKHAREKTATTSQAQLVATVLRGLATCGRTPA